MDPNKFVITKILGAQIVSEDGDVLMEFFPDDFEELVGAEIVDLKRSDVISENTD